MLNTPTTGNLNKIVLLNPKGGCGKTTLATNIASCYAAKGTIPVIMDCDPQGSTMSWLEKRPPESPPIHGIAAFKQSMHATRSWQLRLPSETSTLIVDSPASVSSDELCELTRDASSVLVPVLPSSIDINAASRCIADLLLVAKIDRRDQKLAVIANRTRSNTKSFGRLMRFLDTLGIPVIAVVRDSQNFVHAVEGGIGICELPRYRTQKDIDQLNAIVAWLDNWQHRRNASASPDDIAAAANVTAFRKPKFSIV
jgi:chromosome partitioning protein